MKSHIAVACAVACASVQAASAGVIYSTDFSNFSLGGVNGQNGWATYDPSNTSGGGTFATVVNNAPSNTGNALKFDSGTSGTTSPRYAWGPNYGSAFTAEAAAGNNILYASTSMYMASGSTSAARQGMVTYDATGAKILTGFYVQQNTGLVYLLAYYNNAGTFGNYAFNTNATLGTNQWVTVTTTWNQSTGRMEVFWGANGFYVDGAGAGSIADETDYYNTRNSSTVSSTVYFDNLEVGAVPAPGAMALLGVAGLIGTRRRR